MDNKNNIVYLEELVELFSDKIGKVYPFFVDYKQQQVHWSEELKDLIGLPSCDMNVVDSEAYYNSCIHPVDRVRYIEFADSLFSGEIDVFNISYHIKTVSGKYIYCTTRARLIKNSNREPKFFFGVVENVDFTFGLDAIAGINNKTALNNELRLVQIEDVPCKVLFIGLRNFSKVNSIYGYENGNEVISNIAKYISDKVDQKNCYKCDGLRFAIVSKNEEYCNDDLIKIYEDVRDYIKNRIIVNDVHISVECYGGLIDSNDYEDMESTFDRVFYYVVGYAKKNSEKSFDIYDNEYMNLSRSKQKIQDEVTRALYENFRGFYLVYQPIVDANTESIIGMEALLRWNSENGSTLFPASFMEYIERDPLFYELGNWIIKKAVSEGKELIKNNKKFYISLNISENQIQDDRFVHDLEKILEEEKIPYENIHLELTTKYRTLQQSDIKNKVIYLKTKGVNIVIDNYGRGNASVELFYKYPINKIKIEKDFIDDIRNNKNKSIILKSLTDCMRNLNMKVCVVGIETEELMEYIRANYYITSFQGYYYGKPMVIDRFKLYYDDRLIKYDYN